MVTASRCGKGELTMRERYLFSVSCKQVFVACRRRWQAVTEAKAADAARGKIGDVAKAKQQLIVIEEQLREVCNSAIQLSQDQLALCASAESIVFYLKVMADYLRYLANFTEGDAKEKVVARSQNCYSEAATKAAGDLVPSHPLNVGVLLNYAVFMYDMMHDVKEAVRIAESALNELEKTPASNFHGSYIEVAPLVQALKDNLKEWRQKAAETPVVEEVPPEPPPEPPAVSEEAPPAVEEEPLKPPELPRPPSTERPASQRLVIRCWTKPGTPRCGTPRDRDDPERPRVQAAVESVVERLTEEGLGNAVPENLVLVEKCSLKQHVGCFVYRFGTRRIHICARTMPASKELLVVVRCGGGFVDFADFVRRHGGHEQSLRQRAEAETEGVLRLNSARHGGRLRLTSERASPRPSVSSRGTPNSARAGTPRSTPGPSVSSSGTPHSAWAGTPKSAPGRSRPPLSR